MTYEWVERSGGTEKRRAETFTAFSWERTDKAEDLRKAAGLK